MKERSIKELLQLMLDNQSCFTTGLCYLATSLRYNDKISYGEFLLISDYIDKNPPFLHKINIFKTSPFYWEKEAIAPRIKWLQYHIKKNS
jgi:hypothetical protein